MDKFTKRIVEGFIVSSRDPKFKIVVKSAYTDGVWGEWKVITDPELIELYVLREIAFPDSTKVRTVPVAYTPEDWITS